jgi:hypothetical protein
LTALKTFVRRAEDNCRGNVKTLVSNTISLLLCWLNFLQIFRSLGWEDGERAWTLPEFALELLNKDNIPITELRLIRFAVWVRHLSFVVPAADV